MVFCSYAKVSKSPIILGSEHPCKTWKVLANECTDSFKTNNSNGNLKNRGPFISLLVKQVDKKDYLYAAGPIIENGVNGWSVKRTNITNNIIPDKWEDIIGSGPLIPNSRTIDYIYDIDSYETSSVIFLVTGSGIRISKDYVSNLVAFRISFTFSRYLLIEN